MHDAPTMTGDRGFEKIEADLATLRRDLSTLKWMTGATLALVVAIAAKLFLH